MHKSLKFCRKMWFTSFASFVIILLIPYVVNLPVELTTGGIPHETQYAVCKVVTKEIEATAKATITRQLKGVCSSSDLNIKFASLRQELQSIKQVLNLIYGDKIQYKSPEIDTTTDKEAFSTQLPIDDYSDDEDKEDKMQNTIKLKTNGPIQDEIASFNDTIVETSDGDLYFYYWKLQGISKILRKNDIYISSPPFSLLGHRIFLQFYPNYIDEHLGLLMKPESSSFIKKHTFYFLGQTTPKSQIASRLLYGLKNKDKMFKIHTQMLDNNFIWKDSLLIKVKIYLDS